MEIQNITNRTPWDFPALSDLKPAPFSALRTSKLSEADFLKLDLSPAFDRVVMNPPFAKRADIAHITRAFDLLVPGGELVAIASASVVMRDDSLARDFRDLVRSSFGMIYDNPKGSFKESGTMVKTVTVLMSKPKSSSADAGQ